MSKKKAGPKPAKSSKPKKPKAKSKAWKDYEEVATYLLERFKAEFGLDRVEGKQSIPGQISGTTWEIDVKGVRVSDGGIVIVECRRRTTEKTDQDEMGGLAWRIIDTRAAGGILVNPLGLQKGAKLVAAAKNIVSVQLDENSTKQEFLMRFLNSIFAGLHDTLVPTDRWTCELVCREPRDSAPDPV